MKIAWIRLSRGLQMFNTNDHFVAGLDTQIEETPIGFKITSKDKEGKRRTIGVPAHLTFQWEYAEPKQDAKAAVKAPA